ncbi:MAG: diacylglycerol/polyprenol kinase family protein [Thermoanaerobaculia bacterium]
MIASSDLIGAAMIGGAFVALLVAAEVWARLAAPPAERTRKLVHIGGAAISIFLPLLVDSPLVALGLTASLAAFFFIASHGDVLRSLNRVNRSSRGSEYYPIAIFLLFVLAYGDYWRYLASLLVLGIADAFAALVGGEYGRIRYRIEEGTKSLEGSLVFFIVAFLAIHLPTLLLTTLPRPVTVLAALLVAIIVTGFEAISLRGADNLFVPIAVCVILAKITTKPLPEIVFQNLSLIALCIVIGIAAWKTTMFDTGGTLTLVLFVYGLWSLGTPRWALPVLVGTAMLLAIHGRRRRRRRFGVRAVARTCIPLFAILAVANAWGSGDFWFAPYLAATTVLIALGSIPSATDDVDPLPRIPRVAASFATAVVILAISFLFALQKIPEALIATAIVAAVTIIIGEALRGWRSREMVLGSFLPAILALAAAMTVALAQAEGMVPVWPVESGSSFVG